MEELLYVCVCVCADLAVGAGVDCRLEGVGTVCSQQRGSGGHMDWALGCSAEAEIVHQNQTALPQNAYHKEQERTLLTKRLLNLITNTELLKNN